MTYMSFEDQLSSHSTFLLQKGLWVEEIKIGQGFIRCQAVEQRNGRGEHCYSMKVSRFRNGLIGLMTWVRGPNGVVETHKTYGQSDSFFFGHSYSFCCKDLRLKTHKTNSDQAYDEAARKTRGFWNFSKLEGYSDYLQTKGVGHYGIRFRENHYGRVAVIPLRDFQGALWNCQLLNSNGTKRFLKGSRTRGLFHFLGSPIEGMPIGVCESYVTAATCYELSRVPTATVFSCGNLATVSEGLQRQFPRSPIVIFADNDRHLSINKGIEAARSAHEAIHKNGIIAMPDFGSLPANRNLTDWNDLLRELGQKTTKQMMAKLIEQVLNLL